ncbi:MULTISPECIES: S1/P1 nuclease [unclassified Schlesneria]|uniref:S1/P1 nuclease n=1 Tax=Schlesneria TaxID=656899 RepID=UPI0035C7A57D
MRRSQFITSLCLILFCSTSVFAWNDLGHMTIARIAYDQLTDGERAAVISILRHHPHLHDVILKDRPSQVTASEWIFLRAATWPDHIRPPREQTRAPISSHSIYRYHHPHWHYVNYRIRPGQLDTELPAQPMPQFPKPSNPSEQTNLIDQLDQSYLILRGKAQETSHPEIELTQHEIRAIRMCWLFHLIGDIHQPLHVVAFVDPQLPFLKHGDEGGNKLGIRINHASKPRKLHTVWDDMLGTHSRYQDVVNLSERLSHDPRLSVSRLPEYAQNRLSTEFAEESYQIAVEAIYMNGRLPYTPWSKVESHEVAPESVPAVSPQWISQAHTIAERRVVLAGYRLAARLKYLIAHDPASRESIREYEMPAYRSSYRGRTFR